MTKIRAILAAIALPVTIAALVLTAQGAQASTPGCTSGPFVGWCGTQVDNGAPPLVIDSSHQSAATDNPVIGWTNSTTDPATDWFQLAFAGENSLGVMFFFAPNGVLSYMCMSDPGDGHVRLRGCNGSNWQRWILTEIRGTGYYTWTNRATHRILQSGAKGAQLTTVTQGSMISPNQQWQFAA